MEVDENSHGMAVETLKKREATNNGAEDEKDGKHESAPGSPLTNDSAGHKGATPNGDLKKDDTTPEDEAMDGGDDHAVPTGNGTGGDVSKAASVDGKADAEVESVEDMETEMGEEDGQTTGKVEDVDGKCGNEVDGKDDDSEDAVESAPECNSKDGDGLSVDKPKSFKPKESGNADSEDAEDDGKSVEDNAEDGKVSKDGDIDTVDEDGSEMEDEGKGDGDKVDKGDCGNGKDKGKGNLEKDGQGEVKKKEVEKSEAESSDVENDDEKMVTKQEPKDEGDDAKEDVDKNSACRREAHSTKNSEPKKGKTKEKSESEGDSGDVAPDDGTEEVVIKREAEADKQTIIITETKSLAQAINNAARKPDDGKPTLVIIETKSSGDAEGSSPTSAVTTSKAAAVKASPTKPIVRSVMATRSSTQSLPGHNSLRSALLQGSPASRSSGKPASSSRTPAKPDPSQGVALQDDAEVSVYTPSLVVPYLFECPAKESLTDFVKKIAPPEIQKAEAERQRKEKEDRDNFEPPMPKSNKPKSFFDSPLGQFFTDIGLSQVQQWVQTEILRAQKRKLDKGWKTKERESIVSNLQKTLGSMKSLNAPFQFKNRKCGRCNFVTESKTVLDRHLETIHVNGHRLQCSFCHFDTVDPSQIFHHLYTQHKAFGRLERPPTCHMCPLCPFEDSGKARVTRHAWKCSKTFVPEKNLAPVPDWEPPAKRTRHVASVATLKALRGGGSSTNAADQRGAVNAQQGSRVTHQLQQMARVRPSIVPKPADMRLTPAYVQSVLRGQYLSQGMRASTPQVLRGAPQQSAYTRAHLSQQQQQMQHRGGSSTYILPRQQVGGSTTLTPVTPNPVTTPTTYLQGNQLYQVVRTSVGPVLRTTAPASFTPPRFTILPTPVSGPSNRGPTPVALIPNLATPTTAAGAAGGKQQTSVYPVSARGVSASSPLLMQGNRLQPQLSSTKPNISITPVASKPGQANKPQPTASASVSTRSSVQRGGVTLGGAAGARPNPLNAGPIPGRPAQQQQPGGSNPSYVVCEICDGYIKDLDQLRNHMQWIHKVKIHPKMIHNRPPLNCQKCHYRFFTDQGLERHLLGSHGLVTSSMQENANKGKDGGRCTICGKVFLWKLVVHMAKDHRMTLKPAHLSYKCTVCSATFNMYRLFETHVYEEHSTVAKRVLDGPSNPATSAQSSSSASSSTGALPKKSSSVTVTKTSSASAAQVTKESAASSVESRQRSCVECGKEFRCTQNCVSHYEKSHLKNAQVKLCRVDKCDQCRSKVKKKKVEQEGSDDDVAAIEEIDDDDDEVPTIEVEDDDDEVEALEPPVVTRNGKTSPPASKKLRSRPIEIDEKDKCDASNSSDGEVPEQPRKRARLEVSDSKKVAEAAESKKTATEAAESNKKAAESKKRAAEAAEAKKAAESKKSDSKKSEVSSKSDTKRLEAAKKSATGHSDDDDVFDMEVETVDEDQQSEQSEIHTDVESD